MKKLELPDIKQELDDIFKLMDKKGLKISYEDVQKEVVAVHKTKR
jgi:hypothetical protein